MDKGDLKVRFTYHAPKPGQPEKYVTLREMALALAEKMNEVCPECGEKYLAVVKLEESIMWANAAIARDRVSAIG